MVKLSSKNGTIGKVIKDNLDKINSSTSKAALMALMEDLLKDSTNADKDRFLTTLRSKRSHLDAMTFCYNYMFAGDGLKVLQ